MKNIDLYQGYGNTYQTFFPLDFTVNFEQSVPEDHLARTVMRVAERINIGKYVDLRKRDSYGIDGRILFCIVMYAYADRGYASLRELERLCRENVVYMFMAQGECPSHMAFHRFLHDDLRMPVEDIFVEINKLIEEDDDIDIAADILTVDGSKFEANANKMTFVWKKASRRYYMNTWKKFIKLIDRLNRHLKNSNINVHYSTLKEPSIPYMIEIGRRIEDYMKAMDIEYVTGKGKRRDELQKILDELIKYAKKMMKYEMHFDICGDDRNSFSKTDPDATFMHMKYDYYNHTGVFKPGYNVQLALSSGYVRVVYVSSDRSDAKTLIPPVLELHNDAYGRRPSMVAADAGYGGFDNYRYLREHEIGNYVKFSGIYKEKEKINDKNRFLTRNLKQDDGTYVCPAGYEFEEVGEYTDRRGLYPRTNTTLENMHCEGCPFKTKCTKAKRNRRIRVCRALEDMKQEVRSNLDTPVGIELSLERSIFNEGVFAQIKYNYEYTRLHRRGESGVKMEITLVAIGYNLRRYHKQKMAKRAERLKKAKMSVA